MYLMIPFQRDFRYFGWAGLLTLCAMWWPPDSVVGCIDLFENLFETMN